MHKIFVFGQWWETPSEGYTPEFITKIADRADEYKLQFSQTSQESIYRVLRQLCTRWGDENYHYRKLALENLPHLSGFSPEMINLALSHVGGLLGPDQLAKKVENEFRSIPRGDDFYFEPTKESFLHWQPLGNILHILSGNVFLVGVSSFLEGVVTGNLTLLKLSSNEQYFMPLFIQSILEVECDLNIGPVISKSLATLSYSSQDTKAIECLKKRMDAIVIWGGEKAVRSYRNNLPARVRTIIFGPKLSLALITQNGVNEKSIEYAAKQLCREMIIWDQKACTAPQVCFVEGEQNAKKLLLELKNHLKTAAIDLPPSTIEQNTAAEIQKWRGVALVQEALGLGDLEASEQGLQWTIILDKKIEISPSPLHRTIKIIPINCWREISPEITKLQGYIQTLGVLASACEQTDISHYFANRGVLRVMPLGKMNGGHIEDPHDGAYDLPQYMNLVVTRLADLKAHKRPFEFFSASRQAKIISERLKRTLRIARQCSHTNSHESDLLENWPILDRKMLESSIPESAETLFEDEECFGGHITRSGGSTGKTKFSWFPRRDWDELIKSSCDVFYACGLKSGDRAANFFSGGDLYGSFLSVAGVNEKMGITSFPFSHNSHIDDIIEVCRRFKIDVIQGMPSYLVKILKQIQEKAPDLTFKKLLYAGEPLGQNDEKWLIDSFNIQNISSIIGTTECGIIAYRPYTNMGNYFNTISEYNLIELVDGHGRPANEGALLVTSLRKHGLPIIRYKIGDKGRWADQGDKRLLEYLGRADNIVVVGKLNLDYNDIEKLLEGEDYSTLQLVISKNNHLDQLQLNIESDTLKSKKITEKLLENKRFKSSFDNQFLGLKVSTYRPGELMRNPRTGKLNKIIDRRI